MNKRDELLWSFSLLTICIVNGFVLLNRFFGFTIPDLLRRILGMIDIIAIPVLVYTSVKRLRKN